MKGSTGSARLKPLISVIIPVYNMELWLERCLGTVLAQTYKPLEIILVDDGSSDQSPAMCDRLAEVNPGIVVVHQQNKGLSGAKNTGIDCARGEYLTFVDADDTIFSNYIEKLYELCVHFDTPLSACNHRIVRGSSKKLRFASPRRDCVLETREALENICYQDVPDVSSWGKLYRRTLFEGLRFPEGRIYEDTFLFADIMVRAGKMAFTPEPLYDYIIRDDSLSHGRYIPERHQYIEAVDRLVRVMLEQYPDLAEASLCRRVFAALSVRRFLVDCPPEYREVRGRLERYVRRHAGAVLRNRRVPVRDKVAVVSLQIGPACYDLLWKAVERRRDAL